MRRVDRNSVPVPPSLSSATSRASRERAEATAHYQQNPPPKAAYEFTAYKADDVRAALTALFHGKCAYCESFYRGTQQMDVEHYRPKGRLPAEPHLGYWWLALNWGNLLPSCIDCNRAREQRLVQLAGDGSITYQENVAGKQSCFPIAGPRRLDKDDDDDDLEQAVLIDPTRDNPQAYLGWVIEHHKYPIVASVAPDGNDNRRGRVSIDVYGLNRDGLVDSRAMLILEIALELSRIRDLLSTTLAMDQGEARTSLLSMAVKQIRQLKRHESPDRIYSAMATSFIQQEVDRLRSEFSMILERIHHADAQAAAGIRPAGARLA
jgi:uncharacterized protein (TIGR02646 family)